MSPPPLPAEEVERIAHLARLAIEAERRPEYARDLARILGFVAALAEVDTAGVEPLAHPLEIAQRLRPDEVTETDQRERFQRLAPRVEQGLYVVPKVIE